MEIQNESSYTVKATAQELRIIREAVGATAWVTIQRHVPNATTGGHVDLSRIYRELTQALGLD